jgi:predicted nucleotidyltransferase component of viral defense system
MREFLKRTLDGISNPILGRCLCREYLQARVLQSLQDHGAFSTWIFQGGTALRFLYSIPRFSEDLDFALVAPGMEDKFRDHLETVRRVFDAEGYNVDVRVKDKRTVKAAFVRFGGMLFEVGLSAHRSEVLSIKVEVDSNPPPGARSISTIVRRHVTLNLRHHDKPSLLAGKLHAVLARQYTKGRDIYDLLWYLSDRTWPEPNLELLNNALVQTGWHGPMMTGDSWRGILHQQIETWQWRQIVADVEPFLERKEDVALLTKENLLALLRR